MQIFCSKDFSWDFPFEIHRENMSNCIQKVIERINNVLKYLTERVFQTSSFRKQIKI